MSRFVWRRSNAPARQSKRHVRLQLEELEDRTVPAVFNVGAGDVATLIADIKTANSNGQANTINLTASTYDFTSANNDTFGANALPVITGSIVINGNGAVLERDPSLGQSTPFRFFCISGGTVANPSSSSTSTNDATGSLILEDLTLEGGLALGGSSGTGGGGLGAGGAILNLGDLTLNAVTVEQNVAEGGSSGSGTSTSGGGLGGGDATTAGSFGVGGVGSGVGGDGGLGGGGGAGATPGDGGWGAGNGNSSEGGGGLGAGGAIFNMYGTTILINCTLASNAAEGGQGGTGGSGYGGAIFNIDGTLDVISSTIADNSIVGVGAVNGGGAIYNLAMGTTSSNTGVPSTVTLTDSILADSIGSNDLVNDEDSSTNAAALVNATMPNIITSYNTMPDGATTIGTPITSNPQLSPLANNGGETPTMALLPGSPALGAGATGTNVPTVDQRGVARGSVIDLGAYQSTPASAVGTALSFTVSAPATTTGATVTITATVTQASGSTVPAGTVQFVDTTTGTTLGSVTLSNGQATLTATSVSSGDTITGTFTSSNGMGGSSASAAVAAASSSGGSSSSSSGGSTTWSTTLSSEDQNWLNQVYVTLLHRPIDSTGLKEWGADLNAGTSPTQVVYDIEHTSEYQTDEIQGAFQKLLGVAAPSSAVTYLVGLMQGGADFQTIEAIIVGTPEFYSAAGGTNDTFLNTLYEDFLNRPVDPTGEAAWNALMNAGYSTTQVALGVLSSTEYLSELVNQDYQTYMGVAPDASSLSAFVTALQKGTTNNDMVVASVLGSPLYVVLHAGS